MRTIDLIIGISISNEQYACLEAYGFANGCGGDGKNIDKQLRAMIELIPGFNESKVDALFNDFRKICLLHDLDFFLKQGFIRANFRMAVRTYKLLHWASFQYKFGIALVLFYTLTRFGYGFYKK